MKNISLKTVCCIDIALFIFLQLILAYPFLEHFLSFLPMDESVAIGIMIARFLQIALSIASFIIFFGTLSKNQFLCWHLHGFCQKL